MPTIAESNSSLKIPGIGHIHIAPVGTPSLDLDNYVFTDQATHGAWDWLGDSSSENLLEFETDGGDITTLRTWDRLNVRSVREPSSVTATVNMVSLHQETMKLAFPSGNYDAPNRRFTVPSDAGSSERAVTIVIEDGSTIAAIELPNVDIAGQFPAFEGLDQFIELPLSMSVLSDPVSGALWHIHDSRPRFGGAAPTPTPEG